MDLTLTLPPPFHRTQEEHYRSHLNFETGLAQVAQVVAEWFGRDGQVELTSPARDEAWVLAIEQGQLWMSSFRAGGPERRLRFRPVPRHAQFPQPANLPELMHEALRVLIFENVFELDDCNQLHLRLVSPDRSLVAFWRQQPLWAYGTTPASERAKLWPGGRPPAQPVPPTVAARTGMRKPTLGTDTDGISESAKSRVVGRPSLVGARPRSYAKIQKALMPHRSRIPTDPWFAEPLPIDDPVYRWPAIRRFPDELSGWSLHLFDFFLLDTVLTVARQSLHPSDLVTLLWEMVDSARARVEQGRVSYHGPTMYDINRQQPEGANRDNMRTFDNLKEFLRSAIVSEYPDLWNAAAQFLAGESATDPSWAGVWPKALHRVQWWLWYRFVRRFGLVIQLPPAIEV